MVSAHVFSTHCIPFPVYWLLQTVATDGLVVCCEEACGSMMATGVILTEFLCSVGKAGCQSYSPKNKGSTQCHRGTILDTLYGFIKNILKTFSVAQKALYGK